MTQAAVVDFLPCVPAMFMAFKLQVVSSVMYALGKVAAMNGDFRGQALCPHRRPSRHEFEAVGGSNLAGRLSGTYASSRATIWNLTLAHFYVGLGAPSWWPRVRSPMSLTWQVTGSASSLSTWFSRLLALQCNVSAAFLISSWPHVGCGGRAGRHGGIHECTLRPGW